MAVGLGATIIGWIGGAVGSAAVAGAAFTVSATVAGMIGGMVIGAAIGGLTAAVTGGSIGKGILFGAVGGAVAGGISGYFGGAAGVGGSAGSNISNAAAGGVISESGVHIPATIHGGAVSQNLAAGAAGSTTTGASAGILGKVGEGLLETGVQGAFQMGGQILQGQAAAEQAEEAAKAKLLADEKNREQRMAELKAQLSSSEGIAGSGDAAAMARLNKELAFRREDLYANLEEKKRQFDVPFEEAEKARKRSGGVLAGLASIRRGTLKGAPPSIQEQVFENSKFTTPEVPQIDQGDISYA
jgi:hypothetical protein